MEPIEEFKEVISLVDWVAEGQGTFRELRGKGGVHQAWESGMRLGRRTRLLLRGFQAVACGVFLRSSFTFGRGESGVLYQLQGPEGDSGHAGFPKV